MESTSDLLNLPTISDCAGDRYFNFPPLTSNLLFLNIDNEEERPRPYNWRRDEHRRMMRKYHYDNIFRLEQDIRECDKRIHQLSKGAMPAIRIRPIEYQKKRIVRELQVLRVGWERISAVLRAESRKLFVLPLELRQKIYGYLYTRSETAVVRLDYPDCDVRHSLLPSDPFFYLNASIVDATIAAEAAGVLYDTNTFNIFVASNFYVPSRFLRTDHFGSGVVPKDVIRRLHLTLPHNRFLSNRRHVDVEDKDCRDHAGHNKIGSFRGVLASVLEITCLKVLTLEMMACRHPSRFDYRDVAPIIRMLKQQGAKVKLIPDYMSNAFDEPTQEEWAMARREMGRQLTKHPFYMERDLEVDHGTNSGTRVYLAQHQMVFEARERMEKMKSLQRAKANIDAILAALGRAGCHVEG